MSSCDENWADGRPPAAKSGQVVKAEVGRSVPSATSGYLSPTSLNVDLQHTPTTNMSAYGAIATPKPTGDLDARSYPMSNGLCVTTHPVYGSDTDSKIIDYFNVVFNDELAGGHASSRSH